MLDRVGLGLIMPSLNAGVVRQLGGAFGINLLSFALERRSQLYVDRLHGGAARWQHRKPQPESAVPQSAIGDTGWGAQSEERRRLCAAGR